MESDIRPVTLGSICIMPVFYSVNIAVCVYTAETCTLHEKDFGLFQFVTVDLLSKIVKKMQCK